MVHARPRANELRTAPARGLRAVALVLLAMLVGCSTGPGPDEVLGSFLDALLAGERASAWALLSEADRAAMPEATFVQERVSADPSPTPTLDEKTSYVLDSPRRSGEGCTRIATTAGATTAP